jgi:hypothetical protein
MENKLNTHAVLHVYTSLKQFNSFPVFKKNHVQVFGSETSVFYHKNHIFKVYCITSVLRLNKTNAMAYGEKVQCVPPLQNLMPCGTFWPKFMQNLYQAHTL